MKTIVSNECRSRLRHAAMNGSIIARDILEELKKGADSAEVIRGTVNYLSTKRIKVKCGDYTKVKIRFTACGKNLRHKDFPDRLNPQAPWLPENRMDLEPSSFVELFKNLPAYEGRDIEYFCSAITLDSRVNIRIHSSADGFFDAYNEGNYSPESQYGETTLHNSCMRDEDMAKKAAGFYTNFAGARIIVARDSANNVLGRAIVWPKATFRYEEEQVSVSVIDRIYFSHLFVIDLILGFAQREGIHLRKKTNDNSSPLSFEVLNTHPYLKLEKGESLTGLKLTVATCSGKWHKGGVPYLDTFYHIGACKDRQRLELTNHSTDRVLAQARSTNGAADSCMGFCARCGKVHMEINQSLCDKCRSEVFTETDFGTVVSGKLVKYRNENYPAFLFRKGHPLPSLLMYNLLNSLL